MHTGNNRGYGVKKTIEFINDNNINLDYNIGEIVNLNPESSVGYYRYAVIDCKEGYKFTLNCAGGVNPRAYAFLDENNVLLEVAEINATYENFVV